jgi:putative colanic acid biosysnthesis UDP-glucose lipid carrier transferase
MEKRVEYDLWYLKNWGFMLDLKIIFYTVANIISGEREAY